MYGIFTQGPRGMRWVAMATDEADATAQIEAGDFDGDGVDFVFAIHGITAFRDLDGTRESPEPSPE